MRSQPKREPVRLTRRQLISAGAGFWSGTLLLAQGQRDSQDQAIATATQDSTPRVGVVLSSFAEGTEHDGTKLAGLRSPRPVNAPLNTEFVDEWVRKAIELGAQRGGDLSTTIGPDDWVVIKTDISTCYGLEYPAADKERFQPYIPGSVADLRVVRAVVGYLLEKGCGGRITISEGSANWRRMEDSGAPVDGWTTDWGGAFDGLSYHSIVAEFSKKYPNVPVEIVDLNFDGNVELPVRGRANRRSDSPRAYTIPKVIQRCDKLISIAPLKTDDRTGVSLTFGNFFGIAPGTKYGFPKSELMKIGSPGEIMLDLFSYHPADYCILGGSFGLEGGGAGMSTVHHNLLVAGTHAASVDTVAATLMGFTPEELPHLAEAERAGYGLSAYDGIWTRGNEFEEAQREFRKPPSRG
jgi:hypothetical protein